LDQQGCEAGCGLVNDDYDLVIGRPEVSLIK
jgi:hypothetical protein